MAILDIIMTSRHWAVKIWNKRIFLFLSSKSDQSIGFLDANMDNSWSNLNFKKNLHYNQTFLGLQKNSPATHKVDAEEYPKILLPQVDWYFCSSGPPQFQLNLIHLILQFKSQLHS